MKRTATAVSLTVGVILCAGQAMGQTCPRPPIGPDVIVGDLTGPQNYTPNTTGFDVGYDAIALGTTSCNLGNTPLQWYNDGDVTPGQPDIANKHPVIGGVLYKYTNAGGYSKFEMVGQSWLKHGFLALSQTLCCSNCISTDGNTLGVGCSDPYTASRNGGQGAGPKFQVNASSGAFPYPIPTSGAPGVSGQTHKRIRVKLTDLDNTTGGTGASIRYFGESMYVCSDDAAAGNNNNNCSSREITVATASATNKTFNFIGSGPYASTQRQKAAVRIWKELDAKVVQTDVQVPNDGLYVVSSRATKLADGNWHYEYSVFNMNSDRSGGSFMVPVADGLAVTNLGFRDVEYSSGDGVSTTGASYTNYKSDDWTSTQAGGGLTWACTPYASDQGANAIRWHTAYNFRFDTVAQPSFIQSNVTLGLFKPGAPGDPASMMANSVVPAVPGSADEIFAYLDVWFTHSGQPVDSDLRRKADLNGDNAITADDIFAFLDGWFANS